MIRKKLINLSKVAWPDHGTGFSLLYNCNLFLGCSNNCEYCYARLIPTGGRPPLSPEEWGRPEPVENAVELAEKGIKQKPGRIMFCSMTDPYQPRYRKLTRDVLKVLLESEHYILICTKSDLVRKDYDIIREHENVEVGFSFTSIDRCEWEPHAVHPALRHSALEEAHELGIKTFCSLEPWFPEAGNMLNLIEFLEPYPDRYVVGALNHTGKLPSKPYFDVPDDFYARRLPQVVERLEATGKPFQIKDELTRKATRGTPFA